MSEDRDNHMRDLAIKVFLNEKLEEEKGKLLRFRMRRAESSRSVFDSNYSTQFYYKLNQRIEHLEELLEGIQ